MSYSSLKQHQAVPLNTAKSVISTELLLSLATAPMLLGLLSTQAVFSWLQEAGINSEELFRGERLPILHFPDSQKATGKRTS